MKVACICPTRGRPQLVENLLACFLSQDYPAKDCRLFILEDDSRQLLEGTYHNGDHSWTVISKPYWIPSLPQKYNLLLEAVADYQPDAVIVMEDDDIYLPHHLTCSVTCLSAHAWCHPTKVWSTYSAKPTVETRDSKFHASLGFRYQAITQLGGWQETDQANFDQLLMNKLQNVYGPAGDPVSECEPSYVFRWLDTGFAHGQFYMNGPDDTGWYERFRQENPGPFKKHGRLGILSARYDNTSLETIQQIKAMSKPG